MSGFAVIIDFAGQPVDPAALAAMTGAMAYRGPDGIAHHVDGAVALGHCMLHTTAESLEEVQPLRNDNGSLVLVMDGYLANWTELRGELLSCGAALRTRSDAELVLRAYEQWGDDCPRHIEGEYAVVIWDSRRREAFCLRDHAGLRPLHFAWNGTRLTIASDIAGVLADRAVPRRPNRAMMAEHMANEWFSQTETVWQDVSRVRPAHWMRVSTKGCTTARHWAPPTEVTIRYPRDEDYFAHYRAVLEDSVRRASRTHLPLGCEVSGGLDSSAVFCIADRLLRSGQLPAPDLAGYTFLFEPGGPADEVRYARAVADYTRRPVREIAPFLPDLDWFRQRGAEDCDFAPFPNGAMATSIGRAAVADGCRVVLNGIGGDELLNGAPFHYHEDLTRRDWSAVGRSLRAEAADLGLFPALRHLVWFGLGPRLPRAIRNLRQRHRANRGPNDFAGAFWMSREMDGLLRQRRAQTEPEEYRSIANLPRRGLRMCLDQAYLSFALDITARHCAHDGYQLRSPMLSQRFIEFACSIPEHMRLRGAARKYIHAGALSGWMPELVIQRRNKAHFMIVFERLLNEMEFYYIHELPETYPYVFDAAGMDRLYRIYRSAGGSVRAGWELWGCFSCENVLRTTH